ncbi:ABC transporter permease [Rummeliibacillus sp. NPDC094406]|uniref:ABC transporter permease n=1 Tax=Rummeliibacillus sp. NPDC094406 TaxID=3364511 RepID=UPI0037FFF29B
MLKLLQNEWMKLWHKKGTWVMLIILVLSILTMAGIHKWANNNEMENKGDWKTVEQQSIKQQQSMIKGGDLSKKQLQNAEDSIQISEYRLKNNVQPIDTGSAQSYVEDSSMLLSLISLFATIIAAGIVSSEFATGTIKMLLTRPVNRAKILTSKLLTVIIFAISMAILTWILNLIVGTVLYGFSSGTNLIVEGNKVVESSLLAHSMYMYLLTFGDILMSIVFAFMIGSIFRSSSLAIGLTLFISFMGSSIVVFLSKYEFVKYLWIPNTDLTQFETGYSIVEGLTMPFSLTILAIYAVLFLLASFISFVKRDVTA